MKMNPKLKKAIEIKIAREIHEGQDKILHKWFEEINKMKWQSRIGIAWKVLRGVLEGIKEPKPKPKIILTEDLKGL